VARGALAVPPWGRDVTHGGRIRVRARAGGALTAALRGLDATMGVGVGCGHVVDAHGCRGGGEHGGIGAQVRGRGLGAGSGMDQ
jgi:hypothetical protein